MKKLYGDFDKNDWMRVSGLSENEIPHMIVLHGEDGSIEQNIAYWENSFENIISRPRWNMVIGKMHGQPIGFVNVCWAPMAALIVHKFAAMGTKRFIQTGYCGGLSKDLQYAEIVVASAVWGDDGVSDQYLPGKKLYYPTSMLVNTVIDYLNSERFAYQKGSIISTSAIFLETYEKAKMWAQQGFIGVDGETATTLAVAEKFNAEAISLLTCSDNLIAGDNLYERNEKIGLFTPVLSFETCI